MTKPGQSEIVPSRELRARAFSSEVDNDSRQENEIKERSRAASGFRGI
jgi:hypothetical protein